MVKLDHPDRLVWEVPKALQVLLAHPVEMVTLEGRDNLVDLDRLELEKV